MDQFEKRHQRWEIKKVEEVAGPDGVAIGPFGSDMKTDSYVDSGVPVIRGSNVDTGRHFVGEFVYISEDKADELASANVFPGDLVFPHRGSIGEVGLVPPAPPERWMLSTSLMKFTPDESEVLPEFAYYYFRTEYGRQELLKNSSTVGTPGIGTPLKSLRSIRIPVPPLSIQRRIADILGALDDKIELNRQMNETLEEMAQTLYYRFFEGSVGEDEIGLEELVEIKPRMPVPDDDEVLTYVGMADVEPHRMSVTDYGEKEYTSGRRFLNHDTLMARITPSLENGKTAFVDFLDDDEMAFGSTEFTVMRPREGTSSYFVYCCARDERFREYAISTMTGSSGRQRVQENLLEEYTFEGFDQKVMDQFHEQAEPLFKRIRSNTSENRILAETRDYLLPKLISGEIEVDAAQDVAEDAVDAPA